MACANDSTVQADLGIPSGITDVLGISRIRRVWRLCHNQQTSIMELKPFAPQDLHPNILHPSDRTYAERTFRLHYKTNLPAKYRPSDGLLSLVHEDLVSKKFRLYDIDCGFPLTEEKPGETFHSKILDSGVILVVEPEGHQRIQNSVISRFTQLRTILFAYVIASCFQDTHQEDEDGKFLPAFCYVRFQLYSEWFLTCADEFIEGTFDKVSMPKIVETERRTRERACMIAKDQLNSEDKLSFGDILGNAVLDCANLWKWTAEDSRKVLCKNLVAKRKADAPTSSSKSDSDRPTKKKKNNRSHGHNQVLGRSSAASCKSSSGRSDYEAPWRTQHTDLSQILFENNEIILNTEVPNKLSIENILFHNKSFSNNQQLLSNRPTAKQARQPVMRFSNPSRKLIVSVKDLFIPIERPLQHYDPIIARCWHWVSIARETDWSIHSEIPLLRNTDWRLPKDAEHRLGPDIYMNEFVKPTPTGFKPSRHRFAQGIASRISAGRQPSGNARPPLVERHLSKSEYLSSALRSQHPMMSPPDLDPDLRRAIHISASDKGTLCSQRAERSHQLNLMSNALEDKRSEWKNELSPALQLVSHIHIPLQWALLSALEYPDLFFAYDHTHGKTLAGTACHSFLWHRKDRIPKTTVPVLLQERTWRNLATIAAIKPNPDHLVDMAGFKKTLKEFEIGHMQGPYEINEIPLERYILSRRKTIKQGFDEAGNQKYRNVDDFTASGINDTAAAAESYVPDGFDIALNVISEYYDIFDEQNFDEDIDIHGYVADYATAFRQDPVRPDQQNLVVVAFWNPVEKKIQAGIMKGHPFGAALSPQNFARIPESMCFLSRILFSLPISHYSDDNFCFEKGKVVKSGWQAWNDFNKLVGWELGVAGEEKFPFPAKRMKLLGIILIFESTKITVMIDPDKVANIGKQLSTILSDNILCPGTAGQLSGRLLFVGNAFSGQFGRHFLRPFATRQYQHQNMPMQLTKSLRKAVTWWSKALLMHPSRTIPTRRIDSPRLIIFGDGEGSGSIGAIAFYFPPGSQHHLRPRAFQMDLPPSLLESWGSYKQKINQIEAVVPLICLMTFPNWAKNSFYCHFIDNTSALATMIRGTSKIDSLGNIADTTWTLLAQLRCHPWFEWVPTLCNISDGISRRDFSDPWNLNWELVTPTIPNDWQQFFTSENPPVVFGPAPCSFALLA